MDIMIYNEGYELDNLFFRKWIVMKRKRIMKKRKFRPGKSSSMQIFYSSAYS